MIKIAPSILSADFAKMGEDVESITKSKADLIHVDVMDGVFVPNITFGPKMVKDIRSHTDLPLDVHLMIVNPTKYFDAFIAGGADIITFHIEAEKEAAKAINYLHDKGIKGGIVISPDTPVSEIEEIIPLCDMVLVMSVYPGFGGQKFIESALEKIAKLKELKDKFGYAYDIEVDGGINEETVKLVKRAGVDVIVAGSNVFSAKDRAVQIELLRTV